jgi:ribosomal protein S12 methylthiotransferase
MSTTWYRSSNGRDWIASASSYSREEGTAAHAFADQVPLKVKHSRAARCRDVQRRISNQNDAARIGETVEVLVEGTRALSVGSPVRAALGERTVAFGRSRREAPQVDGVVYLAGRHTVGDFVLARVEGHTDFDRFARPVAVAEGEALAGIV